MTGETREFLEHQHPYAEMAPERLEAASAAASRFVRGILDALQHVGSACAPGMEAGPPRRERADSVEFESAVEAISCSHSHVT